MRLIDADALNVSMMSIAPGETKKYCYPCREILKEIDDAPTIEPTLYGYPVEHLAMIARVLQKENLPPERIAEMLSDIGRIVEMVHDEFEETLRKAASGSQNI